MKVICERQKIKRSTGGEIVRKKKGEKLSHIYFHPMRKGRRPGQHDCRRKEKEWWSGKENAHRGKTGTFITQTRRSKREEKTVRVVRGRKKPSTRR